MIKGVLLATVVCVLVIIFRIPDGNSKSMQTSGTVQTSETAEALGTAQSSGTLQTARAVQSPVGAKPDAATAVKTQSFGSTLDNIVRVWLKIPALQNSNVGFEIMELPSGRILYSFNGRRRFTPASTVKAITTSCAYDTLGPAFTFKTMVVAEGTIADGVLHGNLTIVPSQDPTFTRGELNALISQAVATAKTLNNNQPLHTIDGYVKIAGIPGSGAGFPISGLIEDWGQHWMPVSSNLVLNRNITYEGELPPGYRSIVSKDFTGALFGKLLNTPDGPCWLNVDHSTRTIRIFRPTHPKASAAGPISVSNPDDYAAAIIHSLLSQHGIRVLGQVVTMTNKDAVYSLAQHNSKPLPEILKTCLHKSDNLYAQQTLRTLGLAHVPTASNGQDKSAEIAMSLEDRGLLEINRWLSKAGVPGAEAILFDGCGLSRKNSVSPHALNMVMKHMAGPSVSGPYLALLRGGDEAGYKYKTGTMDTVRAMSGVLTTVGGQNLAVTIMVDSHTPSVRSLRIAESALISQLRAIKHIGTSIAPAAAGAPEDENITETTHEPVVVAPQQAVKKAQPAKRSSSRKHSGSRHRRRH